MKYPWHRSALEVFRGYTDNDRLPHALMIHGPSGCGKVALASDLARELLCLENAPGGCGACRSCQVFSGGAHPDFRQISFEVNSNTGKLRDVIRVSQIRALIEAMYKTTTISPRKVAIIQPAERMNASAANALLKTLEEPVGDTVLILVAHDVSRLPATVRSRCQRIAVQAPAHADAMEWLAAEGISSGEAQEALEAAAGRPLEARTLVENGLIEQYRGARQVLVALRQGKAGDGAAAAAMSDMDPERLWTWLSLSSASLMRNGLQRGASQRLLQHASKLQGLADRNRILQASSVRQDLLLRDWLIQWKQLPATLPLDQDTQEA